MEHELIIGIDLGTTNSEVAASIDGRVRILGPAHANMLPSCVGLSPAGELLVGAPARNQLLLYPERTVRSIKRKMGSSEPVHVGDRVFSPSEISALILRELVQWAEQDLGVRPRKAIITVPAYFSDAQRLATREAGALAGLDVVRILNEPTAASLAYGEDSKPRGTAMVYDLGGGTFDVSIVNFEGDVTEVLASHGNNQLGGDDFTDLLCGRLRDAFKSAHGIEVTREHYALAYSRLWWAAEEVKKRLSAEPYTRVREENLVVIDGHPLHLDVEIARTEYENLIRSLIDSTLVHVTTALKDAGKTPSSLDDILLVGGSTRTPLIIDLLRTCTGREPRQDVHPDLCVALGAGLLAARMSGRDVQRVLIDVSPFTFGISFLGLRGGMPYPYCFKPVVPRNTPLPVTRAELFFTTHPDQDSVHMQVFQGDDEDALKNVPVGDFLVEGLRRGDRNPVLCRMNLNLDGILKVTAIEKDTGLSKHIVIDKALATRSQEEIAEARKRLEDLYMNRREDVEAMLGATGREDDAADDDADEGGETETADARDIDDDDVRDEEVEPGDSTAIDNNGDVDGDADDDADDDASASGSTFVPHATPPISDRAPSSSATPTATLIKAASEAGALLERCRRVLDTVHPEDRQEAIDLTTAIEEALDRGDLDAVREPSAALRELLFFVEGK